MDDFEDRLRHGLRNGLGAVDSESVLADVTRGVARRRRRRVSLAVAASVLLVGGAVGTAAVLNDGGERSVPVLPAPTPTPTPTPTQPVLPPGATQGVIDASAPTSDEVYRLTTNVGCAACSTVWRQDASADGGWKRLHDFGAASYLGKADPRFGPVTNLVMASDGQNGLAWGGRLYSTHDGGETWTVIETGPGRQNTEYGHQAGYTDQYAWSLLRTDRGTELWRSSPYSDTWTRADAPNMAGVSGMVTIGRHVALTTSDEGLAAPRLQYSPDGTTWGEVDNPCPGDGPVYPAMSIAFMVCPKDQGATVYRLIGPEHQTLDLDTWEVFGQVPGRTAFSVVPFGDASVLVIGAATTLMTSEGKLRTDLGLRPREEVFRPTSPGPTSLLITSEGRLLASTDGGVTWYPLG